MRAQQNSAQQQRSKKWSTTAATAAANSTRYNQSTSHNILFLAFRFCVGLWLVLSVLLTFLLFVVVVVVWCSRALAASFFISTTTTTTINSTTTKTVNETKITTNQIKPSNISYKVLTRYSVLPVDGLFSLRIISDLVRFSISLKSADITSVYEGPPPLSCLCARCAVYVCVVNTKQMR